MRAGPLLCYPTSPRRIDAPAYRASTRPARARAGLAGAAALAGVAILAAVNVLPASRGAAPMLQPLSQYAFAPDGWLFDVGVSTLAFGLTVLVSALVRGGCVASRSPARALLTTCSLSLVLVVVFRDHDSTGAVRTAGRIHWLAAAVAFGGLSVAPALLGRHRASVCSRLTSLARRLSTVIGPCFLVMLTAGLLQYETPVPVPAWSFGLSERALVGLEVALAGILTAWAWRGCTCRVDDAAHGPVRMPVDRERAAGPHDRSRRSVGCPLGSGTSSQLRTGR